MRAPTRTRSCTRTSTRTPRTARNARRAPTVSAGPDAPAPAHATSAPRDGISAPSSTQRPAHSPRPAPKLGTGSSLSMSRPANNIARNARGHHRAHRLHERDRMHPDGAGAVTDSRTRTRQHSGGRRRGDRGTARCTVEPPGIRTQSPCRRAVVANNRSENPGAAPMSRFADPEAQVSNTSDVATVHNSAATHRGGTPESMPPT
jgi:hypothetical protein